MDFGMRHLRPYQGLLLRTRCVVNVFVPHSFVHVFVKIFTLTTMKDSSMSKCTRIIQANDNL
uniref:Uncharacterized protein n=1 Tax=Romanomermis culicivorax TaxID=13658 RepID=A0A915KCI4_ROMCU